MPYDYLAPRPGVDIVDVQPRLLQLVNAIGRTLHKMITITSGYRTPQHSVEVGGSATDPHTRGIAVDATIDGVPIARAPGAASLISKLGLVSGDKAGFDPNKPGGYDPVHVQLADSLSYGELQQLWVQAGGAKAWAPVMAAVALAESSGRPGAHALTSREDSRGLWQINVRAHPQYASVNLYDPATNARAAVEVFNGSGPGAWTTYKTGAYRQYETGGATDPGAGGRTYPGGDPSAPADSGTAELIGWKDYIPSLIVPGLHANWGHLWGGITAPWTATKDAGHALMSLVQLIGWLLSPKHWLMILELLVGMGLLTFGFVTLMLSFFDRGSVPAGVPVAAAAEKVAGAAALDA